MHLQLYLTSSGLIRVTHFAFFIECCDSCVTHWYRLRKNPLPHTELTGVRMGAAHANAWQLWPTLALETIYCYAALILLFGVCHLVLMLLDITTKELATRKGACADKPCFPGSRNPWQLVLAYRSLWCGSCRVKYSLPQLTQQIPELVEPLLPPISAPLCAHV